ncbi:MAG: hypothetical protein R3A45_00085 [Bdellovibrionota bacterium]
MRYEQKTSAIIKYSWETPSITKGFFQISSIEGDKGKVWFESNGIFIWRQFGFPKFYFSDRSGYKNMSRDFVSCLLKGSTPQYGYNEAAVDLGVVFEAYAINQVPVSI